MLTQNRPIATNLFESPSTGHSAAAAVITATSYKDENNDEIIEERRREKDGRMAVTKYVKGKLLGKVI